MSTASEVEEEPEEEAEVEAEAEERARATSRGHRPDGGGERDEDDHDGVGANARSDDVVRRRTETRRGSRRDDMPFPENRCASPGVRAARCGEPRRRRDFATRVARSSRKRDPRQQPSTRVGAVLTMTRTRTPDRARLDAASRNDRRAYLERARASRPRRISERASRRRSRPVRARSSLFAFSRRHPTSAFSGFRREPCAPARASARCSATSCAANGTRVVGGAPTSATRRSSTAFA